MPQWRRHLAQLAPCGAAVKDDHGYSALCSLTRRSDGRLLWRRRITEAGNSAGVAVPAVLADRVDQSDRARNASGAPASNQEALQQRRGDKEQEATRARAQASMPSM